ncbi:MAG: GNAT family N-acetyltransferase [Phycisphaerales bacterium]|nr:GNAT family N-acetyltransferase [Phycisphaerales bacterium]
MTTIQKLARWKQADEGWFRDLDNACFPKDSSFLNDEDYRWWVLYEGRTPVAYAGLKVVAWNGDQSRIKRVKFTRCGVLPEHRGKGYQQRLIRRRLAWCRRAGVSRVETYTSLDNAVSGSNLLRAGFTRRKKGDWYTYRLELQ